MRIWPCDNVVRVHVEAKSEDMPDLKKDITKTQDKLEVEELSKGLKVKTDKPHLVSFGGGRLSTAVTLFPLEQGITTIGSAAGQDIRIQGGGIEDEHCYIENDCAIITLYPLNESLISVDGEQIYKAVILSQGCMLCLGHANYFRFNHPELAMKLKSTHESTTHELESSGLPQQTDHHVKGHYSNVSASTVRTSKSSSSSSSSESDGSNKYQDELADDSFRNKLKRFETLTSSPREDYTMSPPPNPHKFSYLNYVGEKLFTKDTNTTKLSISDTEQDSGAKRTNGHDKNDEELQMKPPKPEVKPKPIGYTRPRTKTENKHSDNCQPDGSANSNRGEFKTLSMISTETSIWGSTSSAGTFKLDDEPSTPLSCHTPTDDIDVFNDEMTNSLSLKHQQMIEERKLEEEMEKREQERLEEILAMCAQYEQQIDSEKQLTDSKSQEANDKLPTRSPAYNQQEQNGDADITALSGGSIPEVLSDSIQSIISSSSGTGSDRKNIKTNGSLIQSPTSSPGVFSYSDFKLPSSYWNGDGKHGVLVDPYQDDKHLYDCPADYDIKPPQTTATSSEVSHSLVSNTNMNTSIYDDDTRIYDSPADIFDLPPPIPAHKQETAEKTVLNRAPSNSSQDKNHYRSVDSSSSELTVVSSTASYKTAVPELSSSTHEHMEADDGQAHIEILEVTRSDLVEILRNIKSKIMEVETQQNEAVRELEMEQALLQGEQQTELTNLQTQWQESDMLKSKKLMVINNYAKQQEERSRKIEEAKEKLQQMEVRRLEIEEKLRVAPDEEKDELLTLYENELDAYECQQKVFEDLEFQQLEMEAKYEEESEAIQKELNNKQTDLTSKIKRAEENLAQMTRQQTDMMEQTKLELDEMERQRKILVTEFQKEKQKILLLDHRMRDLQKTNDSANIKYSDTDDMLLTTPAATLNKELLARLRSGDLVMQEERRRLENLKQAAAEASILQWHEQRTIENNIRRFGTLDSEEENMSTRSSETPSDADKISYNSSTEDPDRYTELHQLLAQARYHVQNAENTDLAIERRMRAKLEQQLADERAKRDEIVEQQLQLREKTSVNGSMQRPLTRYLPVREEEFDLRSHIESIGHNLGTCPYVELTPSKCKGYLLKMGTKVKTWNKRWFVFDREKKALLYFMDKSETKPRGGIYFQSIEDVFVDHMRTVKSPNHKFTFCVKTYDKPYYLVAKSPEALSIWIDVIFTGAEGHQEF